MTRASGVAVHKGVTLAPVEEPQAVQTQVDPTIFKSYDVRGVYPSELSEDVAYAIGRCFVPLLGSQRTTVVVGRDMRPSGRKLSDGFRAGRLRGRGRRRGHRDGFDRRALFRGRASTISTAAS